MQRQYGEIELIKFNDLIEDIIRRYKSCKIVSAQSLSKYIREKLLVGLDIQDPVDWTKKTRLSRRMYYKWIKGNVR